MQLLRIQRCFARLWLYCGSGTHKLSSSIRQHTPFTFKIQLAVFKTNKRHNPQTAEKQPPSVVREGSYLDKIQQRRFDFALLNCFHLSLLEEDVFVVLCVVLNYGALFELQLPNVLPRSLRSHCSPELEAPLKPAPTFILRSDLTPILFSNMRNCSDWNPEAGVRYFLKETLLQKFHMGRAVSGCVK